MKNLSRLIPKILGIFVLVVFAFNTCFAGNIILDAKRKQATEQWYYSLALQAATWGAPLVIMYNLRYLDALSPHAKAKPNTIWRMENISTPQLAVEAGYVTPNVNVLYGFGFLDLRAEPIILTAPNSNGRYYMVEIVDMYTNAFAYVGGMATGYKGGKFAIVGPNWKGTLPADVTRIDAPTSWVLVQPRVHVVNQADLPGAKKVLDQITVQGLAEYLGKAAPNKPLNNYPAPAFTDSKASVSQLAYKDPAQFWQLLSIALNENPPNDHQISALLPMFEPLGIQFGQAWDPTLLRPVVLDAMKLASEKIGAMLKFLVYNPLYNGAAVPPPNIGNFGSDYYIRAVVARNGLTANTPKEAIYYQQIYDKDSQLLNSNKNYTLTFTQTPPYYEPGFWSVTIYDAANNYTIPNSINRYSLGSDDKQMKFNADGSLTIYIQHNNPGKDKEANWLPSGNGDFYLVVRAYAPKPQFIKLLTDIHAWPLPAVIPAK